jgi:uncharacterized membrane protein YphA (DoxX/SURF4 family)
MPWRLLVGASLFWAGVGMIVGHLLADADRGRSTKMVSITETATALQQRPAAVIAALLITIAVLIALLLVIKFWKWK